MSKVELTNKEKKRLKSGNKYILMLISAVIIVVLMGIQYLIQVRNNADQAFMTAEVLIDQVESVLKNNERKQHTLVLSLKEDYITRAKAVSYIIDHNLWVERNIPELRRVAKLITVDEIHVFNEYGKIYSGTVPKYYGYDFDSGEQMAYFKPMLRDRRLTMCQDVTPNTAEEKPMMYAICWNDEGTRMIQVGIEPLRLLEELQSNEITEVIDRMPSYDGIDIIVADRNTREIIASSVGIAHDTLPDGITQEEIGLDKITHFRRTDRKGMEYCSAKIYNNFIIVIAQSKKAVNSNIPLSMGITFIYLVIAAVLLYKVFRILTKHILEEQRNANTDPMTGFYNRRAYEAAFEEYKETPPGEHFVYIAMDLNGLKQINDGEGHDEGDKFIYAAGRCMKRCFGNYGRIFRIGGDEFAAMIFDDEAHLDKVKSDFKRTLAEESARIGMEISVSCGYVKMTEFPDKTIDEIAKIADERMYESKEEYYKTHDRRRG